MAVGIGRARERHQRQRRREEKRSLAFHLFQRTADVIEPTGRTAHTQRGRRFLYLVFMNLLRMELENGISCKLSANKLFNIEVQNPILFEFFADKSGVFLPSGTHVN